MVAQTWPTRRWAAGKLVGCGIDKQFLTLSSAPLQHARVGWSVGAGVAISQGRSNTPRPPRAEGHGPDLDAQQRLPSPVG